MSLKLENTLYRAGVNFFARLIKGGYMSASCLLRIIILEETLQHIEIMIVYFGSYLQRIDDE